MLQWEGIALGEVVGSVIAQVPKCGVHTPRELTYAHGHETGLWRCVHTVFSPVSLRVRWGAVDCINIDALRKVLTGIHFFCHKIIGFR